MLWEVGVESVLKFPIKSSRVSYELGTEQTMEQDTFGGWTKLNHRCGSKEIWLCKMSRHGSRAGMECDRELHPCYQDLRTCSKAP